MQNNIYIYIVVLGLRFDQIQLQIKTNYTFLVGFITSASQCPGPSSPTFDTWKIPLSYSSMFPSHLYLPPSTPEILAGKIVHSSSDSNQTKTKKEAENVSNSFHFCCIVLVIDRGYGLSPLPCRNPSQKMNLHLPLGGNS